MQPWLGFKGRMLRQGHEIKLFGGGFELRDEDLEGVTVVSEREQGARVRLANKAEELFPSARDNQAEKLGVVADELILVDGVLLWGARSADSGSENVLAPKPAGGGVWGKLGTHGRYACKVARTHGPALFTGPDLDMTLETAENIMGLAVEMEPNGWCGGATGSHDREGVICLLARNEQARRRVGAGDEDVLAAEEGQHKRAVWLSGRDVQLHHCAGVVAVDGHGYGGE
jgi:hypothetical protein